MDCIRTYWHSDAIDKGYPIDSRHEKRSLVCYGEPVMHPEANLVSSLLANGREHAPAIDLDLPCKLVPSSTPGHHHLLIEKAMSWWKYRLLLRVLVFVGLVEKRYYKHSVHRGMTMLRLPGVRKGEIRYVPAQF